MASGALADARLKELTPLMPVIFIRAIPADRLDTKNVYECPVYKTRMRGPTYVWTFNPKQQLFFFQKKFLIRGVTSFTHSFT